MADRVRYVNTASSGGDGTTNGESGATAAYASLSAAEAAEQTADSDLANGKLTFLCGVGSGSAADTTAVNVAGFSNASSSNYIAIQANPTDTGGNQKAVMPWSDSIYRIRSTTNGVGAITVTNTPFTQVVALQAEGVVTPFNHSARAITWATASGLVDRCHLRATYTNASNGTSDHAWPYYNVTAGTAAIVRNSVMVSRNGGAGKVHQSAGALVSNGAGNYVTFQNCTFIGTDGVSQSYGILAGANDVVATNCIGVSETATGSGDFGNVGGGGWSTSDYNASTDATAPGANSLTNKTFTFVDAANGDYHIDDDDTSGVKTGGDDLSATFTVDFDGVTRVDWSIGADEYIAAAAGGTHELTQTISVSTFSVGPIIVQPVDTDS